MQAFAACTQHVKARSHLKSGIHFLASRNSHFKALGHHSAHSVPTSRLRGDRHLHPRLGPYLTSTCRRNLEMGICVAIEGTSIVRRLTQAIYKHIRFDIVCSHHPFGILPIIKITSPDLEAARLVEETDSSIIARMPALGLFWSGARADGHGDPARRVELQTRVGVGDVEVDGRAGRSIR